jgi:hypothetical protein
VLPGGRNGSAPLSQEALAAEPEPVPVKWPAPPPNQRLLPAPREMIKDELGFWRELPDKGK